MEIKEFLRELHPLFAAKFIRDFEKFLPMIAGVSHSIGEFARVWRVKSQMGNSFFCLSPF